MIKIVFYGNSSGARVWRFADPARFLEKTGKFEIRMPEGRMTYGDLIWADIIITQGVVDKGMISSFYGAQQEIGKKWVVEFDDWIVVEKHSPHKLEHEYNDSKNVIPIQMKVCDMVTTTTPYLAKKFGKFSKNVTVLPNFLAPDRWDVPIMFNTEDTVRIGWCGSMTHYDDFKECSWAIKRILKEFPKAQLCLSGDPRLMDYFEGYNNVSIDTWPSMTSGLTNYTSKFSSSRWDIGIAPIRDTSFNRCKSNIKPLEYGALKIPSIASDVEPYKYFDGNVLMAANKYDWYNHLKNLIEDKNYRRTLGENMYKYVWDNFDLSKNIGQFVAAYESLV
jgi:glycosyltransferase involved in cell wall biosynthesis